MESSSFESRVADVTLEYDEDKTLTVKVTPKVRVRTDLLEDGDAIALTVTEGGRIPTLYDEVTQNGHTFEVQGVRKVGAGYQLMNESGVWEDWIES